MFTVFSPNWNTDAVYDIGVVGFPGPLCLILVYFCQSTLTLTTLDCQKIHWRHTTCMHGKGYSNLQYEKKKIYELSGDYQNTTVQLKMKLKI